MALSLQKLEHLLQGCSICWDRPPVIGVLLMQIWRQSLEDGQSYCGRQMIDQYDSNTQTHCMTWASDIAYYLNKSIASLILPFELICWFISWYNVQIWPFCSVNVDGPKNTSWQLSFMMAITTKIRPVSGDVAAKRCCTVNTYNYRLQDAWSVLCYIDYLKKMHHTSTHLC